MICHRLVSFGCVFSLTIDLVGRETLCKRHKLVFSSTAIFNMKTRGNEKKIHVPTWESWREKGLIPLPEFCRLQNSTNARIDTQWTEFRLVSLPLS